MRRHFVALCAAIIMPATAATAENCVGSPGAGAVRLVAEATGVRAPRGEVAFTVYPDDKRRFLAKGGKLLRYRVVTRAPVTAVCFWLPPGRYALAQYHDENGDHDFNRTLWTPKEGFGFSNDAPTRTGLPAFAAARIMLPPGGATVRMAMRYRQ